MALKFQKRIKILPGVTMNIGKRGISASVGPRGAKVTLHSDGSRRTTVGVPGTGLSSSSVSRPRRTQGGGETAPQRAGVWAGVLVVLVAGVLFAVWLSTK